MEEYKPSEKGELLKDAVGFDFSKLLTTFKELTVRPGETVAAFCDGARAKYIGPVTYFLLAYGINFFVTKASGMMSYTFHGGPSTPTKADLGGPFMQGVRMGNPNITEEQFSKIMNLYGPSLEFMSSKEGMLIMTLPVIVLLQWIFFRSFRKPFLQHVYFLLFVSAQINLLTIPFIIPFYFTTSVFWIVTIATLIVTVGFFFYAEFRFYPGITVEAIVVRTIGQLLAGFIPFVLWTIVVLMLSAVIIEKLFT